MTRPVAKNVGPMLFNNSLRAWQARYKATRAADSRNQASQAGAPALPEGTAEGPFADVRGADGEGRASR
jgi:hypothetical protein